MTIAIALTVTLLTIAYLLKAKPKVCAFRPEGVMLDGSLIEVCDQCTRVRVYIIGRDGDPVEIVELDRLEGESAGDAILRVYREQHGELDRVDLSD